MSDLLGKTIGPYQLIELISQTDKNLVFKGFHPDLNRYVAVKILLPNRTLEPNAVQQFRQEVQLIAGLEHKYILPVYDYGQQVDLLYMVTPYIEGASLQERLPHFYAPEKARRLIQSIAEALDYIHSQGVVHGNLKPSNILINEKQEPLLTDFGAFQNMGILGQGNSYQSPEQAQNAAVDSRTDIYALGVLLYTMMTGEAPPPGAVPSPRLKQPDLPTAVEKVILKAMAQSPEQRFQTAGELAQAFSKALPGAASTPAGIQPPVPSPVQVPPPASELPSEPEAKPRNQWLIAVIGLIILLLLAFGAFFLLFPGSQPATPTPPQETPKPSGPPVAAINGPVQAQVGQPLTFNARNARAAEGRRIVAYDWRFGDGATASGVEVRHTYAVPGNYVIELVVTDSANVSNRATLQVQVAEAPPTPEPDQPPVAVITAPSQANVGEAVTFDASASQGAAALVSYLWDFGDNNQANAVTINHIYNRPGLYNITLTVTDEKGLQSTTTWKIQIVEPTPTPEPLPTSTPEPIPTPLLPEPVFIFPPTTTVGEPVTFDASQSQPGSYPIDAYEWDFGDGTTGSGITTTHTYSAAGDYQVILTVTDAEGFSKTSEPVIISVTP